MGKKYTKHKSNKRKQAIPDIGGKKRYVNELLNKRGEKSNSINMKQRNKYVSENLGKNDFETVSKKVKSYEPVVKKQKKKLTKLQQEKKDFLISHGYAEKDITESDLRKRWKTLFKMVPDMPDEGEWYLCVFFGDNTGNTDVALHRKFYKNLTAEECRISIADTMSTYSEKGSSGVAGNVIVRRFSSKNQMDFEILSMQAKDYIVIGSGKSWTLTEILRLTAFSVAMCTENNRQPTLDAIKAYVEKDLPNISKNFDV